MATAGIDAIRQVSIMLLPNQMENMSFEEIKKRILEKIQPKKCVIIVERANFMNIRQQSDESVQSFFQRLRNAARHRKLERLGKYEEIKQSI